MADNPHDTLWIERRTTLEDDYELTDDMGMLDLSPGSFIIDTNGDDDSICVGINHELFEMFFGDEYPSRPLEDVLVEYVLNNLRFNPDGSSVASVLAECKSRLAQCLDRAFRRADKLTKDDAFRRYGIER